MTTDPRIEAAAIALYQDWRNSNECRAAVSPAWESVVQYHREMYRTRARAALAAADNAATITTFTGVEVNKAGWVCGACEPGDYAKCDDCQSACDDVAQFVNRLIGGTE